MDSFRYIIGFLLFHRRIIIGIFLLIGLYVFLTVILPVVPRFERTRTPGPANETSAWSAPEASLARPADSSLAIPSEIESDKPSDNLLEPEPQVEGSESRVSTSTDEMLRSNNSTDVIREVMRLKRTMSSATNDSVAMVLANDTAKLARRALELQLTPDQRRYAMGSLAEALLILRLGNITKDMPMESVDNELIEVTQEFLLDHDPQIRGYAAIVAVTAHAFRIHLDPNATTVDGIEETVDSVFENLTQVPGYLNRVCRLFLKSNLPLSTDPKIQAFLDKFTERLIQHSSNDINLIGKHFKIELALRRIDAVNLPFQIGDAKLDTENRVDRFFQILEDHPDAGLPAYQIALDILREYITRNDIDRAKSIVERLDNQILPRRSDPASREEVRKRLNELKGFLK